MKASDLTPIGPLINSQTHVTSASFPNPEEFFLTNPLSNVFDMQKYQMLFLSREDLRNHPLFEAVKQNEQFIMEHILASYGIFMTPRKEGARIFKYSPEGVIQLASECGVYDFIQKKYPYSPGYNEKNNLAVHFLTEFANFLEYSPGSDDDSDENKQGWIEDALFVRKTILEHIIGKFQNTLEKPMPRKGDLVYFQTKHALNGTTEYFVFTDIPAAERKDDYYLRLIPFEYNYNELHGGFPKDISFLDVYPINYYDSLKEYNFQSTPRWISIRTIRDQLLDSLIPNLLGFRGVMYFNIGDAYYRLNLSSLTVELFDNVSNSDLDIKALLLAIHSIDSFPVMPTEDGDTGDLHTYNPKRDEDYLGMEICGELLPIFQEAAKSEDSPSDDQDD